MLLQFKFTLFISKVAVDKNWGLNIHHLSNLDLLGVLYYKIL